MGHVDAGRVSFNVVKAGVRKLTQPSSLDRLLTRVMQHPKAPQFSRARLLRLIRMEATLDALFDQDAQSEATLSALVAEHVFQAPESAESSCLAQILIAEFPGALDTPEAFTTIAYSMRQLKADIGDQFQQILQSISAAHIGADPLRSAKDALDAARKHALDCEFDTAIERCEAAVGLAIEASDVLLETRARINAARNLTEFLAKSSNRGGREWAENRKRIDEHLDRSEELGANAADLAAERALASQLDDDPAETIKLARRALSLARQEDDETCRINALVVLMQCYRRLGNPSEAINDLADEVAEILRTASDIDAEIVLNASWLRTKCAAGFSTEADIAGFCTIARNGARDAPSVHRVCMLVFEVTNEFLHAGLLREAINIAELGYELAKTVQSSPDLCGYAVNIAEIAGMAGDLDVADKYLLQAADWADDVRVLPAENPDRSEWATLQLLVFKASARIQLLRANCLDDQDQRIAALRAAATTSEQAIDFATEHGSEVRGNIEDLLAELRWSLGAAKFDLGKPDEATDLFRRVRTAPAMRYPGFVREVGMPAWLREADSLLRAGRCEEANETVLELLADGRATDATKQHAEQFARHLEHTVLPTVQWTKSPAAQQIANAVQRRGLRQVVADQIAPLASWWQDWQAGDGDNPHAGLLDFWGRGGFARVAAALRAKPHSAIAVDATSVPDIRNWARMLCPLFDTVVVKWKGHLDGGVVMIPQHADYGGPDSFGGHGYMTMAGLTLNEDWVPSTSFANLVPQNVGRLLATEARPLISAGRLVLLPAPLVGCIQTAVGWTDHRLLQLLGGIVNVISDVDEKPANESRGQFVLDLVSQTLPYIADIGLNDLAHVLDETGEWIRPFRALLLKSLMSDDLKFENWQAIAALEHDFEDACHQLRTGLQRIGRAGGWHINETTACVAAATMSAEEPGEDPITELLRAITSRQREVAPWIPFWRLHERGGFLNWTHPVDNRSKKPQDAELSRWAALGGELLPTGHGWLYPGTAGWTIPTVRKL